MFMIYTLYSVFTKPVVYQMSFKPRHLKGGAVTFGRSKLEKASEPFKKSLYYLWWEFLRLSDRYKKCCENGGNGELSDLYKDFGDVFSVDFKTWWQTDNRGIDLFAEDLLDDKIRRIKKVSELNLNDGILTISIPIVLPKTFIISELNKLLDKAGKKSTRLTTPEINKVSTAKYKVVGGYTKRSLDICFKIYTLRKQKPEMKLYELARECRIGNFTADYRDARLALANQALGYLRKAERIIESVEEGKFPNLSKKSS